MATTRWKPERPSRDVPDDGAGQCAEDGARIDYPSGYDAGAERLRDMEAEDQECDEVEECGPDHSRLRPEHSSTRLSRLN
jgi:hypothetical protein